MRKQKSSLFLLKILFMFLVSGLEVQKIFHILKKRLKGGNQIALYTLLWFHKTKWHKNTFWCTQAWNTFSIDIFFCQSFCFFPHQTKKLQRYLFKLMSTKCVEIVLCFSISLHFLYELKLFSSHSHLMSKGLKTANTHSSSKNLQHTLTPLMSPVHSLKILSLPSKFCSLTLCLDSSSKPKTFKYLRENERVNY